MLVQPANAEVAATRPSRAAIVGPMLVLAVVQVFHAHYQLGVGNQTIQIPFLHAAADSSLYSRDLMVQMTMRDYPSYFYRGLGALIGGGDVGGWYFALHLLTAAGVLGAVHALAHSMFGDRLAGAIAVLLVLCGHHRALGGDELYSTGFTHTWAVFPLALAAMALLYRGRIWAAFGLCGLMANLHALTAAYLGAMFGLWALCEIRRLRPWRVIVLIALMGAAAAPTAVEMLHRPQDFGSLWQTITSIRSSAHTAPTTWWQIGNPDVPRFAAIVALGALSLSFPALGRGNRTTVILSLGALMLMGGALVFGELVPLPAVMRAQLGRASRLLMVLALVQIAAGVAFGLRAIGTRGLRFEWRTLEPLCAVVVLVCIALPQMGMFLPVALAWATIVSLTSGRLSWIQAAIAGMGLAVSMLAWRTIDLPLPGLSESRGSAPPIAWAQSAAVLAMGTALLWMIGLVQRRWTAGILATLLSLLGIGTGYALFAQSPQPGDDPWVAAQLWARDNTPRDAVFLTPIRPGGFRVHSQRAVIAEWRDGTQAFFSARFAPAWWARMRDLQYGIEFDATGRTAIAPGRDLGDANDFELVHLARKYGATHIVVPAEPRRALRRVHYENPTWAIYLPEPADGLALIDHLRVAVRDATRQAWRDLRTTLAGGSMGPLTERYQQHLLRTVCQPNIERYRKSDVSITVRNPRGQPVQGLSYEIRQTRQAFGFSCSLPFFIEPWNLLPHGDFRPPAVKEHELTRFLEIFNSSLIPFSGKWMNIEPVEGRRRYQDLDAYVDWCHRNGIEMEFHFLSGYPPAWLRSKPREEQARLFLEHAVDLVSRYKDRIKYWQVINETILIEHSEPVFREIRRIAPHVKLGISDCSRFWTSARGTARERDILRGLPQIRQLQKQGIKLDFFGFHGHRPFGLWAPIQNMYEALDEFAAEDLKLHITEFTCPITGSLVGGVRQGHWTPELQAEWYERLFTVCFSHPAVDNINLWGIGPVTWQEGSGLLDGSYQPKPVFHALRELIRGRFRTNVSDRTDSAGAVNLRAFHGDYELIFHTADGGRVSTRFSVRPGEATRLDLRLDAARGTVTAERSGTVNAR